MRFDYSRLLGKIKELGYTNAQFAQEIGISAPTFSLIMNGKAFFQQKTIRKGADVLGIDDCEIGAFFCAKKV